MDRGVLPAMHTAVETFPDDEDLMTCCSRIIWAMSDSCKGDMDANRIGQLATYGGPICVAIVNRCGVGCDVPDRIGGICICHRPLTDVVNCVARICSAPRATRRQCLIP